MTSRFEGHLHRAVRRVISRHVVDRTSLHAPLQPARQPDGAAASTRPTVGTTHHPLPIARAMERSQMLRRAAAPADGGTASVLCALLLADNAFLPARPAHLQGRRRNNGRLLAASEHAGARSIVSRVRWQGKRAWIVPALPELIAELARYRQACGLFRCPTKPTPRH